MARKWLLRLGQTALGIWSLASLVFLLSHLGPVRADDLAVRDASDLSSTNSSSPATRQATRQAVQRRLGLDQPVFYLSRYPLPDGTQKWRWNGRRNQYHSWARQAVRGQLGLSLRNGQPVASQLLAAIAYTFPVVGGALVLALLLAWCLGQQLARRTWWGTSARTVLVALQAMPLFIIALGLLFTLANPEILDWFPAYGLNQPTSADGDWLAQNTTYLHHAALPMLSLVISVAPALALQLEASLAHELGQLYVVAARAKGLSQRQLIRRHALRNSLLPLLTQLTDLLPVLLAGAVVVEVVFALPGMGRLLVHAAATRDYPLLVDGILFTGAARLLALLVADVLYAWADPRIR